MYRWRIESTGTRHRTAQRTAAVTSTEGICRSGCPADLGEQRRRGRTDGYRRVHANYLSVQKPRGSSAQYDPEECGQRVGERVNERADAGKVAYVTRGGPRLMSRLLPGMQTPEGDNGLYDQSAASTICSGIN